MFPKAVAMMLQAKPLPFPSMPQGIFTDLQQYMVVIVTGLIVWFLGQRVLAALLIRRSTAFCPQCFTPSIRPFPPYGWRMLAPFLPEFECRECGKRFFRGRKSPFARCPTCRSSKLQAIPPSQKSKGLSSTIRSLFGAHDYHCLQCERRFFDSRPLRASK